MQWLRLRRPVLSIDEFVALPLHVALLPAETQQYPDVFSAVPLVVAFEHASSVLRGDVAARSIAGFDNVAEGQGIREGVRQSLLIVARA